MKSDKNAGSDRSKQNQPPTKPASWRRSQASSTAVGSHWKQRYRNPAQGAATARRIKLAGFSLASLLLLTALIVTLLYFPRPLTMMAVAVTDLEGPVPPNALSGEDIQRIQETLGSHKNFHLQEPLMPAGDAQGFLQDFKAQLSKLRPKGPVVLRPKAIVVYLSAHGVVDESGNACFLTSRYDPLDSSTWLKATDVLAAVKDCPNISSAYKLILINAGRIRECWPLGVFHNTFADRLADAVQEVNDPQLYVINSTSDDQQGWDAPELNGTSFGYFATQGLAGAANKKGRTVSLQELYGYLRQRMDNFARQYRDAAQVSQLITTGPTDADFPLAYATDQASPDPQPLALGDRSREVAQLWNDFAALRQQDAVRFAPYVWAEAESRLVRLETLMASGRDYDDQYLLSRDRVQQLLAQLATSRNALSIHQASVARARQQIPPAELANARTQFENWLTALSQPDADKKPVPTPQFPSNVAATVAWESLSGLNQAGSRPVRPPDIERGLELVNQALAPPDIEPTEIHFVRTLLSNLAWESAGDVVGEALRIQRTAEEVAAPWDIRSYYWAKPRLDTADRELRMARDQLFIGTEKELKEAARTWSLLGAENGQYVQAEQIIELVSASLRAHDQSLAVSLHFAKWIATHPHLEGRRSLADHLQSLMRETHELSRQIDSVPVSETQQSAQQQRLAQTLASVQSRLSVLQDAFDRCCQDLYIMNAYDRRSLAQIASLLSTPILPQQSTVDGSHIRNVLRERFVQQSWQQSPNLERLSVVDAAVPEDDEFLIWLDGRLHPALDLFDDADLKAASTAAITGRDAIGRTAASDVEKRLASLTQLEQSGGRLRSWLSRLNQTGETLKQQTDKQLASATTERRPCDVRLGLSKADRLFRAAASLIADRELETDFDGELRRLDQQFFTLWHGERALRDFWGPTVAGEESYFARSARSHVQEAMRLYQPAKAYQEELSNTIELAARAVAEWSPLTTTDLRVASDEPLARNQMTFRTLPTDLSNRLDFGAACEAISVAEFDGMSFPWFDPETQQPLQRRPMKIIPVADEKSSVLAQIFHNDSRLRDAGMLQGVTFFRGHRLSNSFRVSTGPTAAMVFQHPDPPRTTIRVRGDQTRKSEIVFVLDCSGSMKARNLFTKAKGVLREIVRRLDPDSYKIGLFAYGHRVGWVEVGENPRRYEKVPRDANVDPANDVERLLELSDIRRRDERLGVVVDIRPQFNALVDNLKSIGETPLYYACELAAQSSWAAKQAKSTSS